MLPRMGLLDDVLWNLGPEVPTLAGRRAARVLSKGEPSEALIVGILVERTADENRIEPEYHYALDVRTGFGTSRAGVRQRLGGTQRSDAHVGATLPVKVHDDKVVIDWGRHLGAEGRSWSARGGWWTRLVKAWRTARAKATGGASTPGHGARSPCWV